MLSASGTLLHEFASYRGFLKKSTLTVFFKNTSALILLLKAAQCAIYRFVVLNNNTYHSLDSTSFTFRLAPAIIK